MSLYELSRYIRPLDLNLGNRASRTRGPLVTIDQHEIDRAIFVVTEVSIFATRPEFIANV